MRKLTGEEIRKVWISFFEKRGHLWVPGVSLIPEGDKSLLWVNAGVTGLKKYFDGSEVPPCRRIVNVQKSIRTNDIENVGHTARHHTFFEMLGNFSIGDYFRKEVIAWAYLILTSEEEGFGLPPERLYATYNPDDSEAFECWKKAGLPASHLIPLEGNYWQIGEGPCGPNTEVFFDRGEKYDPDHLGIKLLQDELENDRYIEIWGIVFSQYDAENGVERKNYKELPSKNIDTGAGLERIACVLQGTETNFETDLFAPIIEAVKGLSGKAYEGENLLPFRVIADHARCLTFALSDGASFSNEGRGYVLRRILRRALRYGKKLGIEGPFMHKLVASVVAKYQSFYPYLAAKSEEVSSLILEEEARFEKTLESGESLLKEILAEKPDHIDGETAFKLYDTYGFPLDLTTEIALEAGVKVDRKGFEKAMEEQRQRARDARGEIESFGKQSRDLMAYKEPSAFLYDADRSESRAVALFKDGVRVSSLMEAGEVILDKTPFYAEMGGQVSDIGHLKAPGFEAKVTYVHKAPNGQHLHVIEVLEGKLEEGALLEAAIDAPRRRLIERNHSATHLLHSALSEVLGRHVDQKGSYVEAGYLRFDYDAHTKLTDAERQAVENRVNDKIAEAIEEKTLVLPIEEAKKLGAEMEFSEKYGATVRVVTFGEYSKEFCGGTHVHNTAEIGPFVILSDEAVASGVRRIEALSSLTALKHLKDEERSLRETSRVLGSPLKDAPQKAASLLAEKEALTKELSSLKDALRAKEAKSLADDAEEIGGVSFLCLSKDGATREDLFGLLDGLKSLSNDYLYILVGGEEGKRPVLVAAKGKALPKVDSNALMKDLAKALGGGGGGKKEVASGVLRTAKGLKDFAAKLKGSFQ